MNQYKKNKRNRMYKSRLRKNNLNLKLNSNYAVLYVPKDGYILDKNFALGTLIKSSGGYAGYVEFKYYQKHHLFSFFPKTRCACFFYLI